jgi:hypothetical protein
VAAELRRPAAGAGNDGVFPFFPASPGGDRQDLSEDSVDGQVSLN